VIALYKILKAEVLQPNVKMFQVQAPAISKKAKPGQFVIIRTDEKGERIPITIAGADPKRDSVTIYFAEVGVSSKELGKLSEGDEILNFSGPLGNAIPLKKYGEVLCVTGGVFQGANYYLSKGLKKARNKITSVICARNKSHMFLVDKVRKISQEIYFATEDGSEGYTSLDFLNDLLTKKEFSHVFTFGPTSMQKAVCEITKSRNIPTSVNLFPIMVDGTGMCGACRVVVEG
jgi:ferredoxin--NADP+ reductase